MVRAALRGLVARLPLFRGMNDPFTFTGGPLRMRGSGRQLTGERLLVSAGPHTPAFTVHCVSGYIACLYLVEYGDGSPSSASSSSRSVCALLDGGMRNDVPRVQFYVENVIGQSPPAGDVGGEQTGKSGNRMADMLKLVVSTHCHPDHIGGVPLYQRRWNIPAAAPERHGDYYRGTGIVHWITDTYLSEVFASLLHRRPVELNVAGPRCLPKGTYFPLRDMSPLPGVLEDWTAIHIPGHTTHMVGLHHAGARLFYAADLMVHHKGEFRAPLPVDVESAYLHTLNRLRGLDVRFLLLAHGGIVDCDERPGGWLGVLDEVKQHCLEKSGAASVNMVHKMIRRLSALNPEVQNYNAEEVLVNNRHHLPQRVEAPAFVAWIRD
jgi:glyoxylase-like metal-dependent hydrolase (beta-lactamase superfamily II)